MTSNILGAEWNLSPDGTNIVTENGSIKDHKVVLKKALDSDLKVIGKSALSNELSKSQVGKIVLQIQKIRNISAPKAKEESQAAPRMLKLTLTDGESYVQAIEVTLISSISRDKTAPGTKVLVNGATVISGYLLINPQNFIVLGGQVDHLFEKWVLAKSVQQTHQSAVSNDGAPPWVPFGCKILSENEDKTFKSLEKSKETNGNSEFDQQRKEAIAEASSGAIRKTFGGRVKQNVQLPQMNQQNRGRQNDRGDNDRGRKGKFSSKDDDVLEKLQKPSEKVSLFSFLEDKLPIAEPKKPAVPSPSCNKNNCQNYHQKDPRIQQKNEAKQNNKLNEKTGSNNYTSREKSSNQFSQNPNASKTPGTEPKSSFVTNNLPQKDHTSSAEISKTSFSSTKHTASSDGDVNSFSSRGSHEKHSGDNHLNGSEDRVNPQQSHYRSNNSNRYSQQQVQGSSNQYRNINDRYSQYSVYPKDFIHPQNRSNYERYSEYQNIRNYPRDNFNQQFHINNPNNRQQYSNSNSYSQGNTQYNQKPHQNQAVSDSQNAEMHQLANNLSKMSVSNEFASRSLRQHLNLGPPKKRESQESGPGPSLNVGDHCLAKYWEDGKFYPAVIAAITDKTYAVQFKGYGNIEEVLKHDCFSTANTYNQQNSNPNYNYQHNNFSGTTMEFRSRRGPPRN